MNNSTSFPIESSLLSTSFLYKEGRERVNITRSGDGGGGSFTNTSIFKEVESLTRERKDLMVDSLKAKMKQLKENVGRELFNSLSFEDKKFMAETAGELDLGPDVNLERIFEYIEDYEDY